MIYFIIKEEEEVFENMEILLENFGYPKILQMDNGGEFKNNIIKPFYEGNNISRTYSSPYHPQINGACEITHKEIQKYICNECLKDKKNLILKLHCLIS